MSRFKGFLAASLMLLTAASMAATARPPARAAMSGISARQLVDHLYTIAGQLPIQTLIVELDASSLYSPQAGGTGNLQPASKDKIFFKKPNKLHIDSILIDPGGPMDGKQVTIIRDGVNCWEFVSMGQYPIKKGPDEQTQTLWLPFGVMHYPSEAGREYALVGRDHVDGVVTDVVRSVDPGAPNAPTTVWIDPRRWVPLRLEMVHPPEKPGAKQVTKLVLYKDIRKLDDGRYFPFKLEWYEDNVLKHAGVYKAVGVNDNLPESLFEPMSKFLH